ncbi:enterochelin esterase [Serratia fonticola]|uniref:enterochelin esterase n=1 Tax=Serratia fonticola TaxID=47917 RepID=UPI000BFBCFB0|nr:enterochelin esterase [Serratia fonticola]ATM77530.1 enterochelin esterase [Serratia fonticola]
MKTEQQPASSTLLASKYAGSHGWWLDIARRGTPLVEPQDNGRWKVTFLWRDPQGGELTSAYQRVWIHINCLTDHHQASPPQSLQRLTGSDVWYWQTELQGDWRGSYCFIPCMEDRPFEPQGDNSHANMLSIRHWWHQVFANATHDLLNPYRAWPGVGGHTLSGLHMPQAPQQPAWRDFDNYAVTSGRCTPAPPAKLQRHTWHSQRLGSSRHVWIYSTGESNPAARPLAILLDGQFWANQMPVWDPLMQLTRTGQLPEAVYLLIDVIDQQHRARELTCNDEFWLALQEELLPQLADWAPHSREAANTVVAGQSFGGLGALYAGLRWPEYFGATISQSGSFWWPRRDMLQLPTVPEDACWLIRQVEDGQLGARGKLKVFLEAGAHEKLVHRVNDRMAALLSETGHQVQYRLVEGGHDALCWRGGLLDGLQAHWSELANRRAELKPSANPLHA